MKNYKITVQVTIVESNRYGDVSRTAGTLTTEKIVEVDTFNEIASILDQAQALTVIRK